MVERRRVVHDRRRLLLEAGHPMSSRVIIASLASLLVACGDETATPTAGADARRYTLALIGDPAITLRVVSTPATSVSADGAHGSTLAGVAGTVSLKVRELDADTGAPIEGDTITFTLPAIANAHWSAGVSRTATAKTGAGGKAQAFLVTSQAAEGPWRVVAASAAGDAQVTFDVTIRCAFGLCEPTPCGGACRIEDVPDVTGLWLTRHDFRIHDVLPFSAQEIFKALRLMDQTLLGQLTTPGIPGWLQAIVNAFVARLLQQYLPAWMQQLIHLCDDLATILGNLRSEGAMRLTRTTDLAHLSGTEVWTSLVFYWLPLCDGEIAGDPDKPPECARIDVLTHDSGFDETAQCRGEVLPSVSVELSPFNATLVKDGAGYGLQINQRRARLTMGKVLLILYDQLLGVVTGGEFQCIEEATECAPGMGCIVDCDGLARDVESATDGIVDEGTVQALCGRGMRAIGDGVAQALARAWPVSADTLEFSGSANVSGVADEARLEDGKWTGDFFFPLDRKLPGTWEATRPE